MNMSSKLVCSAYFVKSFMTRSQSFSSFLTSRFGLNDGNITSNVLCGNLRLTRNQCSVATTLAKKRPAKKKKSDRQSPGLWVTAFSTAEEYDLENLCQSLASQISFTKKDFNVDSQNLIDAVYAVKASKDSLDDQHLFFFREGSVVMWNTPEGEIKNILNFVRSYEKNSYDDNLIQNERESMTYIYSTDFNKTEIINDGVVFSKDVNLPLEKYAISNAIALSVHLGTFEANLEQYIETMEPVTEDLKSGRTIKMSRDEVLQKTGQLLALRHNINLNSDLLDTPDFYWDRTELEALYQKTFNYFCINKRTKVMNEKINHCVELVDLLSSHLNDKHHVRLEWMIIILIMVEVGFEVLHFIGR